VAPTARRYVKPLQPRSIDAFRASLRAGPARRTLTFALRVGRSAVFRARTLFSTEKVGLLKRNLLFPLRNTVLRGRPLALQAGGQSFLLAPEGAIPLEIWSRRYSEKFELEFILRILGPGMTFVDIGANVGLFSVPAAKKVQRGRVFAFEPYGWTYQRLNQNAQLNNLSNLHAARSALGDYTGDAVLQVNAAGKDGLNTLGKPVHDDSEVVATEVVPITTLDDFLRENAIIHIDAMKVDVEGAELLVFRGARNLLAKPDAPLILYESGILTKGHGYHPVETMWLLEQYGYSFFTIDSAGGRIATLTGMHSCDTMLISAKPTHSFYPALQELAR
jgi:FkbM family methyltransferase